MRFRPTSALLVTLLALAGCAREHGFAHCTPKDLSGITLQNAADVIPHLHDTCLVDSDASGQLLLSPDALPYDLQTPLFSDYTRKTRAIHLPKGARMTWSDSEPLQFPTGAVISKTFAWVDDTRQDAPLQHLVETRLLINTQSGWVALTYLWNPRADEAKLLLEGSEQHYTTIVPSGASETASYLVPSATQCAQCHESNRALHPIGPSVRQLNGDQIFAGTSENRLAHWAKQGVLDGAPADLATAPRLAKWDDAAHYPLEGRARAWLEANCAHCHSEAGLARTTGLYLRADLPLGLQTGICKSPVAAGHGADNRLYDIVPGQPDASILDFRIESDDPAFMMPELGRSLVHHEGTQLVHDWVASLPSSLGPCP